MRDYLFQGLHETRSYSLKEHEAAFLKRQNLIFSIEVGSIAFNFFFYQGFLHGHWQFTAQQEKGGEIFYSFLPLPPTHEHWDIYLQLCMWDDYHVFFIATLVFTKLLVDEIYDLIGLPFEWLIDDAMFVCLLDELIVGFCYSNLTLETSGFELVSTITLVSQANRLTKCASHPKPTNQVR